MITGNVLGEAYIKNQEAFDAEGFVPDMSGEIYYEVVRIMGGKFLFLDEHLDRLERSLSGSGLNYPGHRAIKESLLLLMKYNSFASGNIRICIEVEKANVPSLLCYFIPYFYPEECMYKSGVQIVTYPHVRSHPGIKKWDDAFRVSVTKYIRDHGVYEAILLNREGQITEGSRSNIFFIDKEGALVSPPERDILPGITRNHVLQICREAGIPVVERPVPLREAGEMTACFISGTSPKILPVWQLDAYQFDAGHLLLSDLMERFEALIMDHLTFPD